MATRGIVAHTTANGWRGRYAHWDNYPQRMVETLGKIVERDGYSHATHTLLYQHASWSVIDHEVTVAGETEKLGVTPDRVLDGYGVFHDDVSLDDPEQWFLNGDGDYGWAQWLYVMHPTKLEVYSINGSDIEPHAVYTWDEASKMVWA